MSLSDHLIRIQNPDLRILTIDIERLQGTAELWDPGKQYVSWQSFVTPPRTIGVALKWLGELPLWVDERRGREHMLRYTYEAMSRADVITTFNGARFDLPILAADMAQIGLGKVRPFKHIDLFQIARREFKLISRSLRYALEFFGLDAKMETPPGLWKRCMEGDVEAWQIMGQYARQDVKSTEALLLFMRPWLPGTANLGLMMGLEDGCPNCGSEDLHRGEGDWAHTTQTEYGMSQCQNCGTWTRKNFIHRRTSVRVVR